MRYLARIVVALLVAAAGLACVGLSDEERCKAAGGVWQHSCQNPTK